MAAIRRVFEENGDGIACIAARSAFVDALITRLWAAEVEKQPALAKGIAVAAVGGYGRGQLFPCSDIDLLFCAEKNEAEAAKGAIRFVSQSLWDCGLKVSPVTRKIAECERFSADNAEFGLALLDRRPITGDEGTFTKLDEKIRAKMLAKDLKSIRAEIATLTRLRHSKYGDTLFHLEPNIKDCPGGLRDANVCGWLSLLKPHAMAADASEFARAMSFLASTRCYLHYRHERDDNSLDWGAQDGAAQKSIGIGRGVNWAIDAAYWMRAYFRNARVVERVLLREFELNGLQLADEDVRSAKAAGITGKEGFRLKDGRLWLDAAAEYDPASDPDTVLKAFEAMAASGARLDAMSEERIVESIPVLSATLE